MNRKTKITFTIAILLITIGFSALAQNFGSLTITEITNKEFPIVKATFTALKNNDKSYVDLDSTHFRVYENGVEVPHHTVRVDCREKPISVVLVVDQSTSMEEVVDGQKKWSWVLEGLEAFLDKIRMIDTSAIAMTSFSKWSYFRAPFLDNTVSYKDSIMTQVKTLNVYGTTDFNSAFLGDPREPINPYTSPIELLKMRPPDYQRIIVMLTDGKHDILNGPMLRDSIIDECNKYGIFVYGITLLDTLNIDFKTICSGTNGKYFEVKTKESLISIYERIAEDISQKFPCELSWQTTNSCDEISSFRDVDIHFIPPDENPEITIVKNKQYKTPKEGIAFIESESIIPFGDPDINNPVTKDITIIPRKSDYYINGFTFIPSDYFEVVDVNGLGANPSYPVYAPEDEEFVIKVKFTQKDLQKYRQSTMVFDSDPCLHEITLVGGLSQVILIKPNGGEVYTTCEPVDIVWAGVENNVPVNLSYNIDNGPWQPIANNRTNLTYRWNPPSDNAKYKVRAAVSSKSSYLCANSGGGNSDDVASGLDIMQDGLYYYVTGNFKNSAEFDDFEVNSNGESDFFLAKYDKDGCNVIWVETGGGDAVDSSSAVCVDDDGNAYVVGTIFKGAKFTNTIPNLSQDGMPYMFLARYSTNGGTPIVKTLGAYGFYTNFHAVGEEVCYRDDGDGDYKIFVRGKYKGRAEIKLFNGKSVNLPLTPGNNFWPFTAEYNKDLYLTDIYQGGENYPEYTTLQDTDADGNVYRAGTFQGDKSFDEITLRSKGKKDVYVSKYGGTPGSEDISEDFFAVSAPKMQLTETSYDCGSCAIGDYTDPITNIKLQNIGEIPVEIEDIVMAGNFPGDFIVDKPVVGDVILPGGSIDVEVRFNPQDIDIRNARMIIKGTCDITAVLNLEGTGECNVDFYSPIEMGSVSVSTSSDPMEVQCVFLNQNNKAIEINPVIDSGPNQNDFDIRDTETGQVPTKTFVEPDECYSITVTFTPTAPGERKAYINFNLPDICDNVLVELIGYGVNSAISAPPVDWGEKRINNAYPETIVIRNNNTIPLNVLSHNLEDDNTDFTYDTDLPAQINALDSIEIPVFFNPTDELIFENALLVNIEFSDEPITVPLRGIGILPKLEAAWDCSDPAPADGSSEAYLVLRNPSSSAELEIDRIEFAAATADYTPVNPNDLNSRTLDKESEITIPFTFTPQQPGNREADLLIYADNYDGNYNFDWKETAVDVNCVALDVEFLDKIDFGNLLVCDMVEFPLIIRNNSGDSTLTLLSDNIYFSGPDKDDFTHNLSEDLSIENNQAASVLITFVGDEIRDYEATLHIGNSLGIEMIIPISANLTEIEMSTSQEKFEREPGLEQRIPILANIDELTYESIKNLKIRVEYNSEVLKFVENSMQTTLDPQQWTWDNPVLVEEGIIEISGSGNLLTPFNGELASLNFIIYLGEINKSDITYTVIYPCREISKTVSTFELTDVCFLDGRLITINQDAYNIDISPNPASDKINIDFGIGIEAHTRIEVFDVMGNSVKLIADDKFKAGQYETDLSVHDLPSGVYLLKINSGPFVNTKRFVINK